MKTTDFPLFERGLPQTTADTDDLLKAAPPNKSTPRTSPFTNTVFEDDDLADDCYDQPQIQVGSYTNMEFEEGDFDDDREIESNWNNFRSQSESSDLGPHDQEDDMSGISESDVFESNGNKPPLQPQFGEDGFGNMSDGFESNMDKTLEQTEFGEDEFGNASDGFESNGNDNNSNGHEAPTRPQSGEDKFGNASDGFNESNGNETPTQTQFARDEFSDGFESNNASDEFESDGNESGSLKQTEFEEDEFGNASDEFESNGDESESLEQPGFEEDEFGNDSDEFEDNGNEYQVFEESDASEDEDFEDNGGGFGNTCFLPGDLTDDVDDFGPNYPQTLQYTHHTAPLATQPVDPLGDTNRHQVYFQL